MAILRSIKLFSIILAAAVLLSPILAQAQNAPLLKRFRVKEVGATSVRVMWKPEPGPHSYQVYVKGSWMDFDAKVQNGYWQPASRRKQHVVEGLIPGGKYTLRARAVDSEGNVVKLSKQRQTKTKFYIPKVNLRITAISANSVSVAWDADPQVKKIEVFVWEKGNYSSGSDVAALASNVSSYTASGLDSGKEYGIMVAYAIPQFRYTHSSQKYFETK